MTAPLISVAPELEKQGVRVAARLLEVPSIPRKRNAGLQNHIRQTIDQLDVDSLLQSSVLLSYRQQQERFGVSGAAPAAEHLLELIRTTRNLPHINPVVDTYNLVSASNLLSTGAHDWDHIVPPVRLDLTRGDEHYHPLGAAAPETVRANEFACMDAEKIICRMDIKQCEQTRITRQTRRILVYVQGCPELTQNQLEEGVDAIAVLLEQHCAATRIHFTEP